MGICGVHGRAEAPVIERGPPKGDGHVTLLSPAATERHNSNCLHLAEKSHSLCPNPLTKLLRLMKASLPANARLHLVAGAQTLRCLLDP